MKLQTQMLSLSVTMNINNWIKCWQLLLCWLSLAKQIANESIYSSDSLCDHLKRIKSFIWLYKMNWFIHLTHWDNLTRIVSFTWFNETISNEPIHSPDTLGWSRMNWFIHLIHCATISNELIHSTDSLRQSQMNQFIQLIQWDNLKWTD